MVKLDAAAQAFEDRMGLFIKSELALGLAAAETEHRVARLEAVKSADVVDPRRSA